MMIQSILIILPILSTTFAATIPTPFNLKIQYATKYRSPEERRKLGLFPKTNKKFVITEKSTESDEAPSFNEKHDKRPLMPRLKIKNKETQPNKYYFYKEPVTRRPLMKYKKFIVDPTSSQKVIYGSGKNIKEISYEEFVEKNNSGENHSYDLKANDDNSSEAENFKSDENFEKTPESVDEDNVATELALIDVPKMKNNRLKRGNITASKIITYPDISGDQDFEEFIFVKNIAPQSTTEEEFTTDSSLSYTEAVNVIEEENLGTTISVL